MTIRVGESGKPIRLWTKFDMSSYTSLTMVFTDPDGNTFTRTDGSSPPVSLGSKIVDEDLGVINANEYMEYQCLASDFDQEGTWSVQGTYKNTGPNPDDIFISPDVEFEVLA